MSTSIKITGDALPWAQRMQAAQHSHRMLKVMSAAGAKTVRRNFAALDRERHRGGSHHYYAGAARATTWAVTGHDAFIVTDHYGIALRYYGGTIRAKNAGALTIPVKGSVAEGRRASEFSDLFVAGKASGDYRGFLARLDASGNLEPLFWLRKSVTQKADPSVLPTETDLMADMTTAFNHELDKI